MKTNENIAELAIELALKEDIDNGDHTSLACILPDANCKASLKVKEAGILSGVGIAAIVFEKLDPSIVFTKLINDGSTVIPNEIAFTVEGNAQTILKAERLVLNLMQRMSGIATKTCNYAAKVAGTKAKILDTRKTAPCLRYFDKMAVVHGGGTNHRFGLFDMIMIKDNHVDSVGGIALAVEKVKKYLEDTNQNLSIEVEVRNLNDLETLLAIGGIDIIMLDNFDIETTKRAVEIVSGKFPIESSGGITLETIRDYALCGVDFISVGALTHNVKGLDLSLKINRQSNVNHV